MAQRQNVSRLGDMGAMLRAGRGLQSGDVEESGTRDSITRKRRLVAMFCRMLGEQVRSKPSAASLGFAEGGPMAMVEPLSRRERQTLELLLAGNAEKEIAQRLAISRHTVHVYVKSLYKCFGVCSRAELLARWVQR
jgi:DNA-binding CsgD family transcriptional regulator